MSAGKSQPPPRAKSGTLSWVSALCAESPTKEVWGHLNFKTHNIKKKKNWLMTLRVSQGRDLPPDRHMFTTAYMCPCTVNCLTSYLCHGVRPFLKIRMAEREHMLLIPTLVRQRPARAKLRNPVSKPPKRSQILHMKYSICVAKETSRVIKMA